MGNCRISQYLLQTLIKSSFYALVKSLVVCKVSLVMNKLKVSRGFVTFFEAPLSPGFCFYYVPSLCWGVTYFGFVPVHNKLIFWISAVKKRMGFSSWDIVVISVYQVVKTTKLFLCWNHGFFFNVIMNSIHNSFINTD